MGFGFNRLILGGHVATTPELRYRAGATAVCEWRLAVHDWRPGNKQHPEGSEFVWYITMYVVGKQAEQCAAKLRKGYPLLAEGRVTYREWPVESGPAKGTTRHDYEFHAQSVKFLSMGAPSPVEDEAFDDQEAMS